MPAKSVAQRRAMAIAEHHPSELYTRNRGLTKMSKSQLHDFAATKEGALPEKVKKSAKGSGPFSLPQLTRGFKMPGFNSPGITGRLRPRAAFSARMGPMGSLPSRMGSGPMEHMDMRKGYKSMGACKDLK